MCGICGVAFPAGSNRRLDRALIERMNSTIAHRGPDGEGIFVQDGIGLGHRRLSIVDVALGAQPMSVRDGAVQMIYNGEIYNHPTLMPELKAAGVQYRTRSDTETILHLYERDGREMPRHLRGMFAFAIWDARSRELLLARDRLGVKPLYYVHTDDGSLFFASEIKALLAGGAVQPSLNLAAFPDYLANHGTCGEDTLFEGVKRLPPGHTLVWHEDEPIAHPSSIALNFVSRLAAERVKVVLTGEGSDETLGGYGRYRYTIWNLMLGRTARAVTGSAGHRLGSAIVERLPRGSRWQARLRRTALSRPATLDDLYFDNFAVFDRRAIRALLAPAHRETLGHIDPYAVAHELLRTTDAGSTLNQLLHVDLFTYLHELLMKQDQMSMAASIESRVPFLDHPLIEFTATLPERLKLRGGTTKYVLREAMRDFLPPEILSRSKMGFPVPVGRWFREAYTGWLNEFVLGERANARGLFDPAATRTLVAEHASRERDHTERLWALVNVELWHRIFVDGESPEDVGLTAPALAAAAR